MPGPAAGEGKVPFRNAKEEIRVGFGVQGSEGGGGGREKPGARGQRQDIVWRNVFLMSLLHLGAVYSLVLIPKAQPLTLLWAYFCFLLTALGVTAGAHRLWSHRSYKAKLPLRIFLAAANSMAFQVASQPESCLQTSCNFLLVKYGPRTTSSSGPGTTESTTSTRRRTLIPTTPAGASSSPISGGCLSASIGMLSRRGGSLTSPTCWLILWSGSRERCSETRKGSQPQRCTTGYYKISVVLMCFMVPTLVPWCIWGESLWNSYFLASILRYTISLNVTWLVNSVAHMYGNRPYDKNISPRQNPLVTLGAIGEGFHNYHHTFPFDYSASEFGLNFNPTTWFIDFMCWLGLATDRKRATKPMIEARKARTGEGSA
ncbi:stearoyl-CoA desaturase 5 isoform X1 [Tursiops truncatus]|uniref:stearoyl-CoA desaturase 5 isoform X1 n=1 Tax=Tursiops truncatus TaxID=9739 RepID=UPI003CCF457D